MHSGRMLLRWNEKIKIWRRDLLSLYYEELKKSSGGSAFILSSSSNENSKEVCNKRRGIFSYYLIKGLEGSANTNEDKIVTIKETFEYVRRNVQRYTKEKQNPILTGEYDPNMPMSVVSTTGIAPTTLSHSTGAKHCLK